MTARLSPELEAEIRPVGYHCDHSDEPIDARTHHDWEWVEGDGYVFQHQPDTISSHSSADQRYLKSEHREIRCARALPVYTQGALVAEVRRLQELNTQLDRALGETIDDRDRTEAAADKLAYAVAPIEVIGEHSSMNAPWENAHDLITPMAEVDGLKAELAKRPSRYSATPAEVDQYLRRHFTEEVVLNFQRAIGQEAVGEAVAEVRVYRNHPDNAVMKQAWRTGVDDAVMQIDPAEDAGWFPSKLLCSQHNGFGPCPGAPRCTPGEDEGATS